MGDMVVRMAVAEDAEGIAKVEAASFNEPWSLQSFKRELEENDNAFYFVGEVDDEIIAYVGLWAIGDEGHITNLAVHPGFRGKNIGSALMTVLLEITEAMGMERHTLEVRPSNRAAIALYENMGFREVGVRPKYYQDTGEDAIIMWRGDDDRWETNRRLH